MRVLLDETSCDVQADTVGEAVAAAAALAEERGRMIVEVIVDGQLWTVERLDSPEFAPYAAREVRLTTAAPVELVSRTFADAASALGEAAAMQQRTAELLQTSRVTEAMQEFERAISIWQSVQQALTLGAELMDLDLSQPLNNSRSLATMISSLNEQLTQMHTALASQDTLALADTLLYDFPPVVEQWQRVLQSLPDQLRVR